MVNLLRFHFYLSRRTILLIALVVAFFLFLHTGTTIHIGVSPFSIMLFAYIPSFCISHLLNEQLSYMIRLLPVTYKQFVQSAYLYVAILFAIIFIPGFTYIIYQFYYGYTGVFKTSFFLGLFAFCIVCTGGMLSTYFKQPTKAQKAISTSDMFLYFIFVAIGHTLICFIFSLMHLTILGALIVPAFSFFIYYKFYQSSVRHFAKAEY